MPDTTTALDNLILTEFPYPIAVGYRRVLEASDWPTRIDRALRLFEYGLRTLGLDLISQYLIRDADTVSDPDLNTLLLDKLPKAPLGSWKQILFTTLHIYGGLRHRFFMPELYDLYWDTSHEPHEPRADIQHPYDRLIQIQNDLRYHTRPTTDMDWQALGEEVMADLREVLGQFAFLQGYDFVQIVGQHDTTYDYLVYTGERPVTPAAPLTTSKLLDVGRFYLSKDQQDFLELHPLLIFWEDRLASIPPIEQLRDAGVYETFTKTSVTYILALSALERTSQDPGLVGEFVRLLYLTIEQDKQQPPHEATEREGAPEPATQHLTWSMLQDIATQIAERRFKDVRAKYQPAVYLQRQDVKAAFDDFLASDKTVFLLLGKSGVGKSNFILSVADEHQADDSMCLLLYDGANLEVDKPLSELIGRDFEARLRQLSGQRGQGTVDVLAELGNIEGIENHRVLLFIDAINENAEARSLLRRVNALVESVAVPWFKVVLSSRPEAWRVMKRGVKLPEQCYYRAPGGQDTEGEFEASSYGVTIKAFTKAELPQVYAKYRQAYSLQTPYEAIPDELRSLLNDPLTLKLVAETYRGQTIPQTIRLREIYEKYVAQMIRDERLRLDDIVFLEEELLPLMIAEDRYENAIPADVVNKTRTASGRRLFELIHNDEKLSNGNLVNQSYMNLANAEILVIRGSPIDYKVTFKYERFYDYYGGKRLFELYRQRPDKLGAYLELIASQLREKQYLWGAVKSALGMELEQAIQQGQPDLLLSLATVNDTLVKELVVATLVDFGRDRIEAVRAFIQTHLVQKLDENALTMVETRLATVLGTVEVGSYTRQQVGIEVAYHLELTGVLEAGARSPDPAIRNYSAQYVYYLWNKAPHKAFDILEHLSQASIARFGLPNRDIFEACITISILIAFESLRDAAQQASVDRLQQIWRPVLARLLRANPNQNALVATLTNTFRNFILGFATPFVIRIADQMPKYYNCNTVELAQFFKLPQPAKERFRRIVPYIDPAYGSLEDIRPALVEAAQTRDIVTLYLVFIVLSIHGLVRPAATLPIVQELWTVAMAMERLGPYPQVLIGVLYNMLMSQFDDTQFRMMEDFVWTYFDRSEGVHYTDTNTYQFTWVDPYLILYDRRYDTVESPAVLARLDRVMQADGTINEQYNIKPPMPVKLRHLYLHLTPTMYVIWGQRRAPRRALHLLYDPQDKLMAIMLPKLLATLRKHMPDEVDDFMDERGLTEKMGAQVRAKTPLEGIGDLVGGRGLAFANQGLQMPWLRQELIALLSAAPDCKNLAQWAERFVKQMVNLVNGEPIFDLK